MATTNDLKNGMVLVMDNGLWSVVEFQHVKPGKGPAFVRTKLKNATVDRRDMQYLYNDGTDFIFMDSKDYEQIPVSPEIVGDAASYMLENTEVVIAMHDGRVLFVELPASVVLTITETEPGLQGDRSNAGTKPATVETGLQIQVPLFLEEGVQVKVDTRSGDYLGRA
jgi:elongation factor P